MAGLVPAISILGALPCHACRHGQHKAGHDVEGNVLRRTVFVAAALIGIVTSIGNFASAQDYPTRPVKIVVPFGAGGGTDALARFIAHGFEQRLGQPFIIENKGGAGTTLGATMVANSEPDGYTIMLGTASTFAAAPGLYKHLAYDPTKDFSPIMLLATVPFVLTVNPLLGVHSVKELIALAKSKPGELTFATAGVGSVHHMFMELLMSMTGIELKHVPYRGGGQAINDVVAGHVPVYFADVGPAASLIKAGRLTALGVTTATRSANLPDVPTLDEAGVKGYDANTWQMMVGPARMPAPVVAKLNGALLDFMKTPETQKHFVTLGMQPTTSTPAEAQAYIDKEAARWTKLIRAIGVTMD
jgi:tripartite-type tricarboxylate transporter receptor subunit TctC